MKIRIVLPFENAERETPIWAVEEKQIDFRLDPECAARCTSAFAALELKHFLARTLAEPEISFSSSIDEDFFCVQLLIQDNTRREESFAIEPTASGIVIIGSGRTGLLYGCYEFLRMQGWRWYAPGQRGEVEPAVSVDLNLPKNRVECVPSMNLGRGFDFEGASKESEELLIWMAHNRLNLAGYGANTRALCNKLGMSMKVGGHIFEKILDPDRPTKSGKTLLEDHQAWYGLPPDGVRKKETALATQFCVSQPDLIEFLAEEILQRLRGEWKDADRIDIWGLDTWGNTCGCEKCRELGNSTDQILYFLSALRSSINAAISDGQLDHDVRMVMCAYEGTATMNGPERAVPQNLLDAGDYVTFYPINRCYQHDFNNSSCSRNQPYSIALDSWLGQESNLPIMVGEYYNVSRFEDLPLLFSDRISKDLPDYYNRGVRGLTYMHVPLVNWGMRTLTQVLYAMLAWDIETDTDSLLDEYFANWYGPYFDVMRQTYEKMEEAWELISSWRAWDAGSVLAQLQAWDGGRPEMPLKVDDHFSSPTKAVESGRRSIELLENADYMLQQARNADHSECTQASERTALNPVELSRIEKASAVYEYRLGEDHRLLRYGLDTMRLMTELVAYYDALYREDMAEAERAWNTVEQTAESLDSYYVPMTFPDAAGFESRDALTRTQLRDTVRRCRSYRMAQTDLAR